MQKLTFFIKLFTPVLLIIIVLGVYIDRQLYNSALSQTISTQNQKLELKKNYIGSFFRPIINDIKLLANQSGLKKYLESSTNKDELIQDYLLFAEVNKTYVQVRIIDAEGRETIRINYDGDTPSVVPDSELQYKTDRLYFTETMKSSSDHIYISPIELNREQGVIEIPYRPVLRVAMPLFDRNDNRKGIIITNYEANQFLSEIDAFYKEQENFYLLNSNGYMLTAPEEYPLWGFMLGDSESEQFGQFFPEIWEQVTQQDDSYLLTENGLFVYKKIALTEFNYADLNPEKITSFNSWILVNQLPPDQLDALLHDHRKTLIPIILILTVISFIVFLILTRTRLSLTSKEEELVEVNTILEAQKVELIQKNKELEQFVYITSHDLQEPLRTILSYTELLQEDYGDKLQGDGQMFLKYLSNSSTRLLGLVKGILEYSRIGRVIDLEEVDLNILVNDVLADLNYSITQKKAAVHVTDLPTIKGYKGELHMLFQNLISNGLKFQKKESTPVIEVKASESAENHIIEIADNGIGMDTKFNTKVFQMFQRLHDQKEFSGTGIGLSLCKKIVDLHNGSITFTSEPGEGTTFIIKIPKHLDGKTT